MKKTPAKKSTKAKAEPVNEKALILADHKPLVLAMSAFAEREKAKALAEAKKVKAVANYAKQEVAVVNIKSIKTILADLEKGRQEVKAPLIQEGRNIDQFAKDYAAKLKEEMARLEGLVAGFQAQEHQKAEEAQQKANKEAERLLKRAEGAKRPDTVERLTEAAQEIVQAAPEVEIAAGVKSKKEWVAEVIDIKALYLARPDLCTEPTARLIEINRAIKEGARNIPGLSITEQLVTKFR